MSSSGGGDTDNTIRYAPYLESAHGTILNSGGASSPGTSVFQAIRNALTTNLIGGENPYGEHSVLDINEGFFGTYDGSVYCIGDFPSLFDMFGKFMAGLDVCDLWGRMYEDVVQGAEVSAAVAAHSAMLQDDIDTTVMPKFLAGMRDINATQSSAFIVGKSLIQSAHVKAVNEFQSKIRLSAIQLSSVLWSRHLDWNHQVSNLYGEFFKLYHATKLDTDKVNMEFDVKDKLWDLGVLDHGRSMLGAMAGAPATTGPTEDGGGGSALGGALSGAAAGGAVGGVFGAVVGGVLGAAASFF